MRAGKAALEAPGPLSRVRAQEPGRAGVPPWPDPGAACLREPGQPLVPESSPKSPSLSPIFCFPKPPRRWLPPSPPAERKASGLGTGLEMRLATKLSRLNTSLKCPQHKLPACMGAGDW